jgi:hypothetical protein
VVLGNTTCSWSCHKPQLLHKPCSHVLAARFRTKGWHWGRYMSRYYLEKTILDTWNHTLEGHISSSVRSLKTPKEMQHTYLIQILNCAKALVDGRRRGSKITWMKLKLVVQWRSVQSATTQETPTRNALQQCTLAMHLVRQTRMMLSNLRLVEVHLRDVDVDIVAAAMKECIKFSCLISLSCL